MEEGSKFYAYRCVAPSSNFSDQRVFDRYFTKNKNRLRNTLVFDHTPPQEMKNGDFDALGQQNYQMDGFDVDIQDLENMGQDQAQLYDNGGLTQMNAPVVTNRKLDLVQSKKFDDIFQDEKFLMKQVGVLKVVELQKYSKPTPSNLHETMNQSAQFKLEENIDDLDYKQMFVDYGFKGQDIHEIKSSIYNIFIKKLITLRELEFKQFPILEVDDPEEVIQGKMKKMAEMAQANNHYLQYQGFRRPAFARDGEQLRFQKIVRLCLNIYWRKGIGLNHHIIFLCLQHLVNEYGIYLTQFTDYDFVIDYDAKKNSQKRKSKVAMQIEGSAEHSEDINLSGTIADSSDEEVSNSA